MLPQTTANKAFDFDLGWINDGAATVYFNGTEVKPTMPYAKFSKVQPRFHVPKELVRPSQTNTLTLRLHGLTQGANWGQPVSRMGLPVENSKVLDNQWKFEIEKEFPPLTPSAVAAVAQKTPMAQIQNTSRRVVQCDD